MPSFHYYSRPEDVSHQHPYLVVDCRGELHLPLTVFAKEAHTCLAQSSAKKYLAGILPWFTWLDTDHWQVQANHRWTDPPEMIRDIVREYLVSRLECLVKDHPLGGEWIDMTEQAVNTVRILLAGLKLFYRIAKRRGYYIHANPLIESSTDLVEAASAQYVSDGKGSYRPKLPDSSGVDTPNRGGRLTDSYFLLKDTWIPQVVTDTTLPQKILNGGRKLKEKEGKDWGLREECFISLLFDTGARVSELMALTFGDWNRRGLKETAWARNKGSRKRRAKFIRLSEQTVKLLKRYIDSERAMVDANHYKLDNFVRLAECHQIDLDNIPLFLSKRGTAWTVASFRANYWKKACAAAKIDVDIHQARHWYVTQAIIEIHEQARKGKTTVERGEEELIAYMHWRSGEQVLKAYNHFYQPACHATVQDNVFKKLRHQSEQGARRAQRQQTKEKSQSVQLRQPTTCVSEGQSNGTAHYAFLTGKGGFTDDLIAELTTGD